MAEVLEAHDFGARAHGNAIYPWSEWTDGETRRIVRGEDFTVDPRVMAGQVKVRGGKEHKKTATHVQGDAVIFTFQRDNETVEEFVARTKPTAG